MPVSKLSGACAVRVSSADGLSVTKTSNYLTFKYIFCAVLCCFMPLCFYKDISSNIWLVSMSEVML